MSASPFKRVTAGSAPAYPTSFRVLNFAGEVLGSYPGKQRSIR